MKRELTLSLFSLILGIGHLFAAYTTPESGKVYRIHNVKNEKVIGEDAIARQVRSVDAADNSDFSQLWVLNKKDNGYLFQNAYSGQYLSHCSQQSTEVYPTSDTEAIMYITAISGTKYAIGQTTGAYLHLDGGNSIVRWWDKDTEPSQWQFEEVEVSSEAITLQQAAFKKLYAEYMDKLALMEHLEEYNTLLPTFFADTICTELRPAYVEMSDEELCAAMSALPTSLQNIALKIKNQSWGHREQEFRIRSYKAYSDPDYWAEKLYTKKYSRINNPTGIYGKAGDVLYIFVGNDIPEGATLKAEIISGTGVQGTVFNLNKGLNMVPTVKDYSNLFIQYVGETSLESETLITDYPELKIHIEEGVVNGFWNIEEHDDADWVDMMTNLATADAFQVKGERIMFHMSKHYMKMFCKNTITDAIGWWDNMTRWQQDMLGIEDVRLTKFNNLGCAISLTTGYQSATHYRTQYLDSYVGNLLPYDNMMSNADNCWGPAHENGHVHQAAIQSVGTSEVSNNFFSNLTMFKLGRYTSRGNKNDDIFADFAAHKPYILRDGASTMRSFWQLYLYFHAAEVDTTFYPRVLQAMRATPMKARDPKYYANEVYGNEDLLLFAKACCDVAQMDLSEFFRFWGYLELTEKQHIGDYGDFYLTTRQSDVDEFLTHVSQYPKAPSIIFIEDRVKAEPRTDGGTGSKLHHGNAVRVGEAGDVGHYTDFMDTTVKAEGYLYDKDGTTITISGGTGALGFKVYTKENVLISGSNRLTFKIPAEYKMHEIIVVAAQADGTDVRIPSIAEKGTEEQQLEILKKTLTLAKEYVQKTDSAGLKINFFRPDSVTALAELIIEVESVIQNSDQSKQSYGAWAIELNSAIIALHHNSNARIPFTPYSYYSLAVANNTSLYMEHANAGLRSSKKSEEGTPESLQWKFISTESGDSHYIQHRTTGKFITAVTSGQRVKAESSDIASAVSFRLIPDEPGCFLLQCADEESLYLYNFVSNNNNYVYAGNQTGANAKWNIQLEDAMLDLPETSKNELLTIYHLLSTNNGEYAYSYMPNSPRNRGRIATAAFSDKDDTNFWFYFKQGSEEDKYTMYNFATKMPITISDGNLFANKEPEEVPEYAIELNEQGSGFTISSAEGTWFINDSVEFAVVSTKDQTVWKLQRAQTIDVSNEPLSSLTISKERATLTEGDSIMLTVTTAPEYAADHSVTWSSSDEGIATVDSTGKVKAIAAGSATITATANDASGLTATCKVTVKKGESNVFTSVSSTLSVQIQGSVIFIDGLAKGTTISVYDTAGKAIATTIADSNNVAIDTRMPQGSTLIVKIAEYSFKLQAK